MPLTRIREGLSVRVVRLGPTEGWRVRPSKLRGRAVGRRGSVVGPVFGHRRKVLLVSHGDGSLAAYHVDELAADR